MRSRGPKRSCCAPRLVAGRLWVVIVAGVVASMLATASSAAQDATDGGFSDVTGGVHKPAIDALAATGVFEGTECEEGMFCPDDEMKRWTMGVWLVRVLDEAEPAAVSESSFADVDADEWWLPHVERLAELEVTTGCLVEPLRFCPDGSVTRAQMATFLTRALDLDEAEPAGFVDTVGNFHAADIDALAAARITAGCATDPLRYCPDRPVTRAEMATFLARALGWSRYPHHPRTQATKPKRPRKRSRKRPRSRRLRQPRSSAQALALVILVGCAGPERSLAGATTPTSSRTFPTVPTPPSARAHSTPAPYAPTAPRSAGAETTTDKPKIQRERSAL